MLVDFLCEDDLHWTPRDELHNYTAKLMQCRYLEPRTRKLHSNLKFEQFLQDTATNPTRFKRKFRMSPHAFENLVQLIGHHGVFSSRSPLSPQRPAAYQLLVALRRFGSSGNAMSMEEVADDFDVSVGTVEMYTRRSMIAIQSIESTTVFWPANEERNLIKHRIENETRFRDCIGFVDGTLIPFDCKPSKDPEDWFSHKSEYGMAAMIVCDDQKRIREYELGYCGSAHDQRVFKNSRLLLKESDYFSGEEYLLADSGYAISPRTVIPYSNTRPSAKQAAFNLALSQARIRNEHCIGILKSRFQSLRGLRIMIRAGDAANRMDINRIMLWITCCIILHNLLIDSDPLDFWEVEPNNRVDNGDDRVAVRSMDDRTRRMAGERKRSQMADRMFPHLV